MRPRRLLGVMVSYTLLSAFQVDIVRADEVPFEYRACVSKGLDWLAKQQSSDGRWASDGGQYPEAMTALSGMAFLMEGSTLREGKYADRLRKAVAWLMSRTQPNGLIAASQESGHYMYGHGYAMLFLSCVYGEESDGELRRKLEDVLTRAALFSGQAQSRFGSWSYTSAADAGGGGGDSSSMVTQMRALRSARNAGIVVSREVINKGLDYLKQTTSSEGSVAYSWFSRGGGGSLALTAAALASAFSAGDYNSDLVKKWVRFCRKYVVTGEQVGHDEYTHYYLSQCMYFLGENRYAKLFPDSRPEECLTWSKYRKALFDRLRQSQAADGSWKRSGIGTVYDTAVYLIIMQLDNATLPIFQR